MADNRLTIEDHLETLRVYEENDSVAARAAVAMGITASGFKHRLRAARSADLSPPKKDFEVALLPSEELTLEEIKAHRRKVYERKDAGAKARKLIPVKVNLQGPIGILHFGDPHVDDDGCDFPLLESHVELVRKTPGLLAGNVGDLHNNWVGRLAKLYAQQSTTARQSWMLVEWLVTTVNWLYIVKGNHDCHDMQTEALTKNGWKLGEDITQDDEVLSLDHKTGVAEWTPILNITRREHDGEMIRLEANGLDLHVTPNHRVLNRTLNYKMQWRDWSYTPADKIPARMAVPVSGRANRCDFPLTDDQISLTGWLLTDGGIYRRGGHVHVAFYQSKDGSEIDRLLNAGGFKFRKTTRKRKKTAVCGRELISEPLDAVEWHLDVVGSREITAYCPEKGRLPQWANDISERQFNILLDAIVAGDGTWDGKDPSAKNCAVVHGTYEFLSSLQSVAVQHGWRARIAVVRGKDYRLNLAKTEHYSLWTAPVTKRTKYKGDVWCLTVPHGNFMVRRNGVAHFSGNCWSGSGDPLDFIKRYADTGIMESHGARLELAFPNGKAVRVNARHDFSGHSMWNPNHGPVKAIKGGWRDHILTCGHKHETGFGPPIKDPASGLISWPLRCAGYKRHDRYADELGLPDQNISPAILTVIDPQYADDDPRLITPFLSAEEGADFLTWKRKRK